MNNAHTDVVIVPYRNDGKQVPPIEGDLFKRMLECFTQPAPDGQPARCEAACRNLVNAMPGVDLPTYYHFIERYAALMKLIKSGQVDLWISPGKGVHAVIFETAAQCRLKQDGEFNFGSFRFLALVLVAKPKYGISEALLSGIMSADWSKPRKAKAQA